MAAIGVIAASGCSANFEIGRPKPIIAPAGDTVIEPNGTVIEPQPAAIETVITGLNQAQSVRTLTRQLAR